MFPQIACLLMLLALGSTESVADTNKSIRMAAVRPTDEGAEGDTLQLKFTVDLTRGGFERYYRLIVKVAEINDLETEYTLVHAYKDSMNYGGDMRDRVTGVLTDINDEKVELDVTWSKKTDGYCYSYLLLVDGLNNDKQERQVYKRFKVQSADGSNCGAKKSKAEILVDELVLKVDQCHVPSDKIEANSEAVEEVAKTLVWLPHVKEILDSNGGRVDELTTNIYEAFQTAQNNTEDLKALDTKTSDFLDEIEEKVEDCEDTIKRQAQNVERYVSGLMNIFSLNSAKYDVSSLYKGHVYIVSKSKPTFNFKKLTAVCEESGGYLAEFDDLDEVKFVGTFVESTGQAVCATGANDLDNEGHFVYYTSKKPLPDGLWRPNEPSNSWGNENCVQVTSTGLNDIRCNFPYRYVCEVPVL